MRLALSGVGTEFRVTAPERVVSPENQLTSRVVIEAHHGATSQPDLTIAVDSLVWYLDQQHQFRSTGNDWHNWGGRNEKWIVDGDGQWYFITETGGLYDWDGRRAASGVWIASLDPAVHANPELLTQPERAVVPVTVSADDMTLNLTRASDFRIAPYSVTVTASDGVSSAETSFVVDTVTGLAVRLDQEIGLTGTGNFHENWGGVNEKWIRGDDGQWYFLLPDGQLRLWDRSPAASGPLVASLNAEFHQQPELLLSADAIDLDYRYGFIAGHSEFENWAGEAEKWFSSESGEWYFILPDGMVCDWDGGVGPLTGTIVGNVAPMYHSNPADLHQAVEGVLSDWSGLLGLVPACAASTELNTCEVEQLLDRASAATVSEDAIIAVVDRAGNILGVRTEAGVSAPDDATLSFMIDGAVAKARTAAFFSNGDLDDGTLAPLTSRTVRFISQSTVTEREVNSNPNALDDTVLGPGFVAPIGIGGHFPPEVLHTPPVDLFAIEHTNRDSLVQAGPDGMRGTLDDIVLDGRFDADFDSGKDLMAPESYGFVSGRAPAQQSRGMATLPGGIPIFRDVDADGTAETLIGGIGVFFPGPDGFASFEQGFVSGIGQTETERTNADRVLEAEYIAFAAVGGSPQANAVVEAISGIDSIDDISLPFGSITLVGITLEIVGPIAGFDGPGQLLDTGRLLGPGSVNGTNQPVAPGMDGLPETADDVFVMAGTEVPDGWLVSPRDGLDITADEVLRIIEQGIAAAEKTRAAVRLPVSSRTRMVFSVTDRTGEVVGLYRMPNATVFSIDVAVAKARNTAYYADASALEDVDTVSDLSAGVAFSNRTFRFLAEPRFPSGVDGSEPGEFSILNNPSIDPATAENIGSPAPAASFDDTVLGYDAFHIATNFRDASTEQRHQNGIVFFPGSTPLYRDGLLIGGFGVSGDGVDQDDVVTFLGAQGFLPAAGINTRADEVFVRGVRLPYIKFLRNPFG